MSDPWPTSRWHLRLLGTITLEDASRGRSPVPAKLPSRAAALLLARLALAPERAHPREEIVELLWPGVDLDVGRNRLRQALSVLRSLLEPPDGAGGPVLVADRLHLRLAPGALACDVAAFEAARRGGDHEAARDWYRGELMPGHYDEWVHDERLRLAALAGTLEPARGMPSAAATRPRIAAAPSNLPLYLTPVFGQAAAASALVDALDAHRLVTVVGPGGGGKTRLAVEAVRALATRHGAPDIAFAALAACATRAEMADRVALALRLDAVGGDPLATVRQALAGRRVLLVLDNLEQAAVDASGLAADLLSTLPDLRLLATSRVALDLAGEHLVSVAPLPAPDPHGTPASIAANPAAALYVDRARERRADFHLGPANAESIATLVGLLEGQPLAIELAAARVRSTPPARWVALLREAREAAARGDEAGTLPLLSRTAARAGTEARHASMAQVVEASWTLLDEAARTLLGALGAFDGPCDADAARALGAPGRTATEVQVLLDELVASSLLVPTGDGPAGPRFAPYETVREYAAACFPAAVRATWRSRHRAWLRGLPASDGATPDLTRLREALPELQRGLATALHDDVPDEAWAIVAAHRAALADVTLPASSLDLLETAAAATDDEGVRLFAHAVLAAQGYEAGRHASALAHALAVLAGLGSPESLSASAAEAWPSPLSLARPGREPFGPWCVAWALRIRMRVGQQVDEHDPWLLAALASARAAGAGALEARLLGLQASFMMRNRADHAGAEPLRRRALALYTAAGDRLRTNEARIALAICLGFQHRIEEQLPLLAQAEAEARALRQPRLRCFALSVRGYCLADLRRHDEALAAIRDCLREAQQALAWRELFYGLWNLPRSLAHRRAPEAAARVMGFAEAFYAQRFGTLGAEDLREARRTRRLCAVQLGAEAAARAWADGAALGLDAAVALALQAA